MSGRDVQTSTWDSANSGRLITSRQARQTLFSLTRSSAGTRSRISDQISIDRKGGSLFTFPFSLEAAAFFTAGEEGGGRASAADLLAPCFFLPMSDLLVGWTISEKKGARFSPSPPSRHTAYLLIFLGPYTYTYILHISKEYLQISIISYF